MEVYKVCRKLDDNIFISAMARGWQHFSFASYALEYGIGVETVPKYGCGPLAGFSKFSDAAEFVRMRRPPSRSALVIFRAIAVRSLECRMHCRELKSLAIEDCPNGTVLCDSIKLIDKLQ